MAQMKVVVRVPTMTDDKSKQKAFEAVADIYGIDSISADLKDSRMTVIGDMDTVAIAKKLRKLLGKVDIVSVGPAKEEKKPDPAAAKKPPAEEPPKKKQEPAAAAADKKPAAAHQDKKKTADGGGKK